MNLLQMLLLEPCKLILSNISEDDRYKFGKTSFTMIKYGKNTTINLKPYIILSIKMLMPIVKNYKS